MPLLKQSIFMLLLYSYSKILNMTSLPKLSENDVQTLATELHNDVEPFRFFVLHMLFHQSSGCAAFDSLSERLACYLQSQESLDDEKREQAKDLVTRILNHFREKGVLSQTDYDVELAGCKTLLSL